MTRSEMQSPSPEDIAFGKRSFQVKQPAELPSDESNDGSNDGSNIESEIIQNVEGRIIDEQEFKNFMRESGFIDGYRGTYESKDKEVFLSIKRDFLLNSEEEVNNSLLTLKYLVEKGVLHPSTKFGTYKTPTGQYQIFLLTRKLEAWTTEREKKEGRDKVRKDIGESTEYKELLTEGSHVLEWMRRVDPAFDPNKKLSENSLLHLLNPAEASHSDNWGWDEKGKLYPIDVQVVSIVNVGNIRPQRIIEEWIKENKVKA